MEATANGRTRKKLPDLKVALALPPVGMVAGLLVILHQLQSAPEVFAEATVSDEILILVTSFQVGLYAFLSTFFGMKAARRLGLLHPLEFKLRPTLLAVGAALVTALVITFSDQLVFANFIPELDAAPDSYTFSWLFFGMSVLYGGIIEELLMRLLLMSAIALGLWKLFDRKAEQPPQWTLIAALIVSTVLFAAGHWGVTVVSLGSSLPVVVRMMLLNGIGGILFGLLYWKHGLHYAVIAHAGAHIIMQLVLLPLMY